MMTISSDIGSRNCNGNGNIDCDHANASTRNIRKSVIIVVIDIIIAVLVVTGQEVGMVYWN